MDQNLNIVSIAAPQPPKFWFNRAGKRPGHAYFGKSMTVWFWHLLGFTAPGLTWVKSKYNLGSTYWVKFYAVTLASIGGRPAFRLQLMVSPFFTHTCCWVWNPLSCNCMHWWLRQIHRGRGGLIAWPASSLLKNLCVFHCPLVDV